MRIRKGFARGVSLLRRRHCTVAGIVDQGVVGLGNLAVGLLVLRASTKEEYGLYSLCYMTLILLIGFSNAVFAAQLTVSYHERPRNDRDGFAASLLRGQLMLSACLSLAGLAVVLLLPDGLLPRDLRQLLAVSALACPAVMAHDFLRSYFFLVDRPITAVTLDLLLVAGWFGGTLGLGAGPVQSPTLAGLTAFGLSACVAAGFGIALSRVPLRTGRGTALGALVDHAARTPLMPEAIRGLTIRVHTALRDAEADWETPGLAGYAFGRQAWLRAWHDTLGVRIEPALVVVADARVRMVLPLGIRRAKGLRVLEFLGGNVTDYNAPLVDPAFAASLDASSVRALWERIVAALPPHDTIRMLRMPDSLDAPDGVGAGRVPNPLIHLPGARRAGLARSLVLPDSYAALVGSLRPQFAADTRRRWRRLAEVGRSELVVAADAGALSDLLAVLKRMKSRRWRETGDRDWFADPAFAAFYDAMSRMALSDGRVHGSSLTVAGKPVAAHLGLVYRGRFYLLLLGWESGAWHRFSTGRLILDAMLKAAIDEGLQAFDFTVGDEAYKREWTDTELPLFCCEGAVTARGRLALAAASVREELRARAKRVVWLRRLIRKLTGRPALCKGGSAIEMTRAVLVSSCSISLISRDRLRKVLSRFLLTSTSCCNCASSDSALLVSAALSDSRSTIAWDAFSAAEARWYSSCVAWRRRASSAWSDWSMLAS